MVQPAIKLKAQLSPSTSELLLLCPSKTLCPYCKVTRNVIVDMSKLKESFLKECRGFCCLGFFVVVFCWVFFFLSLASISASVVKSLGHRFCSGNFC